MRSMVNPERNPLYIEAKRIRFADEIARRSMELRQQIHFLNSTLPPVPISPEGYDLTPVSFEDEYSEAGIAALFYMGDFMQSQMYEEEHERRVVKFVEPRTLQILDALQIPYVNHAAIKPSAE